MKKTAFIIIICLLFIGLAGCGTGEKPVATGTTPAITKQPIADTPTTDAPISNAPTDAANVEPTLSQYFPTDRITLPPDSKVIGVSNDFADNEYYASCWEKTLLELAMTKTEAIDYFTPMLNSGEVNHFEVSTDTSDFIPWEIEEDYPDVVNYVELYAYYPYDSEGEDIALIKVLLFTKEDKETIIVARIEVNYNNNPGATPTP